MYSPLFFQKYYFLICCDVYAITKFSLICTAIFEPVNSKSLFGFNFYIDTSFFKIYACFYKTLDQQATFLLDLVEIIFFFLVHFKIFSTLFFFSTILIYAHATIGKPKIPNIEKHTLLKVN